MAKKICSFSLDNLIKMKENKTIFYTAAGRKQLLIADIDEKARTLKMERSTGKITWSLDIDILMKVHQKIHSGELDLNQYDIDQEIPTWGNYVTGLFQYFRCRQDSE